MSGDTGALLAADRAARRLAQAEFSRPLVLEAGAGTGKTTALVARLLAWCLGPGWEKAAARAAERDASAGRAGTEGDGPGSPSTAQAERVAAGVLRGVVAITFTEAAAAEMAERAGAELGRLAAAGDPPGWLAADLLPGSAERTRRAQALAATLDHLAVRTIHAFCRGLLAEFPLEAGLHPAFGVDADGSVLEEVVRETVEAALRRAYVEGGEPHLLALAARGVGPQRVADALAALYSGGVTAAELAPPDGAGEEVFALIARLRASVVPVRDVLDLLPAGRSRKTPAVRDCLRRLAGALDRFFAAGEGGGGLREEEAVFLGAFDPRRPDAALLQQWVASYLPEGNLEHLKKLARPGEPSAAALTGEQREALARHTEVLVRIARHVEALDPELLQAAREALSPLLLEVERVMRARGAVTYQGLLDGAVALLAGHPGVRARVRRGIDQLLVDEFQDTDRVQCDLLGWLALDGPAEERPGLFLVGDPKQSIYGWRSADLAAYAGFVERVREAGGEVRPLVENFRSVPAVLDEVTRLLSPVMRERPGVQPRFEPLVACERLAASPGYADAARRPVEHWITWAADESDPGGHRAPATAETSEIEAAALVRDLAALRAAGLPLAEIAILLRGTGDLDVYLEALRRAGIPFLVGRDKQYYRRREVIDAAALVRAVLDPGDHLALLTVLRSSLCGVPDAALLPLWRRQLPRRMTELSEPDPQALAVVRELVEEAAREVPPVPGIERIAGWEQNLLAAVEHLAELRRSFARDPADVFVEKLRALSLVEPVEAARTLGVYRLANLERFFRTLGAALEEGSGDASAVLRALRRSVAAAREAEEGRPAVGLEDAVQVMTIHGAKGLDFGHVYVPQLHRGRPPEQPEAIAFGRAEGRLELRLFGAASAGFDLVEAQREEVEAAERVRMLYVATTRAKDRLVLLGRWPEEPAAPPPERARSLLDLVQHRPGLPEPGLPALWAAARAGGGDGRGGWKDGDGVLWRFPALEEDGGEPEAERAPAVPLPSPAEAARLLADLEVRREAARRRMARPYGAPATAEAHERLREERAAAAGDGAGEPPRRRRRFTGASGELFPGQAAALAAGSAVHSVLEDWDLEQDPERELNRQLARLPLVVEALAGAGERDAAAERASALLTRAFSAGLVARLRALGPHILARELPVLLPPPDSDTGAAAYVAGTIDLLYQHPDGTLVVADYKTDQMEGAELTARAAVYATQGAAYTRAVQEALGLPQAPRFELWFLAAGEVVDGRGPTGA